SHFNYDEGIDLAPGRYTLETAVLDMPSQKLSARKASFVIPAPSDSLGISSVTLIRNTKAKEASTKADDPMLMSDKVVLPTVNPVLKKYYYNTIAFYLTIYTNKKSAETQIQVIMFTTDRT